MIKTAAIITIGDELLLGQTIDTNGAWIGQQLSLAGVDLIENATISDVKSQIIETVQRLRSLVDLVLITGGLGPTRDDVTKVALTDVAGVHMVFDTEMWSDIQGFFEQLERKTTNAHRQQCFMPAGITKLPNKMGTAPGMLFDLDDVLLVSMPGVPYEMKYIMEHGVLPIVREHQTGAIVHHTILTVGVGESRIAEQIDDIVLAMPDYMALAFLPSLGAVRLRISAKGDDKGVLTAEVMTRAAEIKTQLGEIVYGEGDLSIEQAVGDLCLQKKIMIGTAESCTGGRIASRIVSKAGSSAYYGGGVVTYTNALKNKVLGVPDHVLRNHGAVSEQTVKAMVAGAVPLLDVDVAVSISGIAGPSGGIPTKPVGTIWMAVGNADHIETKLTRGSKDRDKNIEYASTIALDLIRKFVTAHY